jgi:pentatricopeptide repeat protein
MDMFCKCGCVNRADYIIDTKIVKKDSVSWNTIIGGFEMHGDGEKALDLIAQMKQQGFRPDAVTLARTWGLWKNDAGTLPTRRQMASGLR